MAAGDDTETKAALRTALGDSAAVGGQAASTVLEGLHAHVRHTSTALTEVSSAVNTATGMTASIAALLVQLDARYALKAHTHG